jgi:class 3 adenylate cyclase
MMVGGPPNHRDDHAHAVADAAIEMVVKALQRINEKNGTELAMRVGIHSAPIVASVIGKIPFTYDLWGDTVNVASRMESSAYREEFTFPSKHGLLSIHISSLKNAAWWSARGLVR